MRKRKEVLGPDPGLTSTTCPSRLRDIKGSGRSATVSVERIFATPSSQMYPLKTISDGGRSHILVTLGAHHVVYIPLQIYNIPT